MIERTSAWDRPTDVTLGEAQDARVDLIESLGAEALVHLELDGKPFLAMVPEPVAVDAGQEIKLGFQKVHRFHRETGERL